MAGTKYPVILTSHMQEAIEGGAWIEVECVEAPCRVALNSEMTNSTKTMAHRCP